MNDDIKGYLTQALPDEWDATGASAVTAIERGTGIRRRRRILAGGGAATGLAAVAAVAVLLTTAGAGQPPAPAGESGRGQAVVELPRPEDGKLYRFDGDGSGEPGRTDETRRYTEAFWDYLAANYSGFEEYKDEPDGPDRAAEVLRFEESLIAYDDDQRSKLDGSANGDANAPQGQATGYTQPVYSLTVREEDARSWPAAYKFDPDVSAYDELEVTVHPAGGFKEGIGEPYELGYLADCTDRTRKDHDGETLTVGYDCAESNAPTGEKVVNIREETRDEAGDLVLSTNRVVFYAENGTAIVIADHADVWNEDDVDGPPANQEPHLDQAALAGFALALADSGGIVE